MFSASIARRIAAGLAIAAIADVAASAQQPASRLRASRSGPHVTAWGDPDIQGTWPSGPMMEVAFERARDLGSRSVLTDEELARRAAQLQALLDAPASTAPPSHWLEIGKGSRQASLVVDPPDGRLPPLTPDGLRRAAAWPDTSNTAAFNEASDLVPYDRCITRGVLGSAFPNAYSSGMQILQAPGYVVIRHEMIHEARIIPLDGRARLSPAIRSYMGDPRGHWEGSTLVVETANFNGRTGSFGRNANGNPTSEALRLVERFTLVDADTLQYEVRIDDPQTFTRPWTVAFPLTRDTSYTLFEYACHEGNYAIAHILSAARAAESAAAATR